jgi:hypothetical protein
VSYEPTRNCSKKVQFYRVDVVRDPLKRMLPMLRPDRPFQAFAHATGFGKGGSLEPEAKTFWNRGPA